MSKKSKHTVSTEGAGAAVMEPEAQVEPAMESVGAAGDSAGDGEMDAYITDVMGDLYAATDQMDQTAEQGGQPGDEDEPRTFDDSPAMEDGPVIDTVIDTVTDAVAMSESFRRAAIDILPSPDTVWPLDPEEIIVDPARNGRTSPRLETDADVKELAKAIAQDGQMQPGEVHLDIDGRMYITFGFGRLAAINLLNKTREPVDKLPFMAYVRTGQDSATLRLRNANENWKRKELTILDKAQIVTDMMSEPFSLNQTQVAQRLGLVKATVSNYVKVQSFPAAVKDLMRADKIGRAAAMDLCAVPPDKIGEIAAKLVAESGGKTITSRAVKKKSVAVAPSKTRQLTMSEFIEALDYLVDKKNEKQLHGAVSDIIRIIGDIAFGRLKSETALKRLAAYQ